MKVLFWACAAFVFYAFVGYAALVWLLARLRPQPVKRAVFQPSVSLVITVHNAANFIEAKLKNLSELSYPKERLEIIVASDGSTDASAQILSASRGVKTVVCPRVGKAEALNRALAVCQNDIVVFTDIRQEIEAKAISELMANFADDRVGCVSGELMFSPQPNGNASGISTYWRLEKAVRKYESASGSVIGATGALYAVRRHLIPALPSGTLLDDVYIPLQVLRAGKRVVFEPEGRAWDKVSDTGPEFLRKVRTLAGNFQILGQLPWTVIDSRVAFRFVSHKLTRLIAPWLLVIMLADSWALSRTPGYLVLALLQSAFYGLALLALWLPAISRFRIAGVAQAFCVMNTAAVFAAFRYLRYRNNPTRLWVVQSATPATQARAVAQEH